MIQDQIQLISTRPIAIAIEEIHEILSRNKKTLDRFGLANGYLGLSVFSYLYGVHTGNKTYFRQSEARFNQALELINKYPLNYPFDFIELGMVCQFLSQSGVLSVEPNSFLTEVDQYLLVRTRHAISQADFGGFANGLLGNGLYFLDRARHNPGQFAFVIQELASSLTAHAVQSGRAAHWYPDRPFPLPLWNGQASIILFLAASADIGFIEKESVAGILGKAIHFLYDQFKIKPISNLLSHQLGDLGIGYSMLRAGQVFEDNLWYNHGLDLLGQRAGYCLANADTVQYSAMLTGAAGAAIAFDKIYAMTANPLFQAAAQLCFARLLPLYQHEYADKRLLNMPSGLCFGTGLAGVGAALIKFLHRDKLDFDQLLWLI